MPCLCQKKSSFVRAPKLLLIAALGRQSRDFAAVTEKPVIRTTPRRISSSWPPTRLMLSFTKACRFVATAMPFTSLWLKSAASLLGRLSLRKTDY